MTPLRKYLLAALLLVTFGLAYFLRSPIYEMIVVPLAYLLWVADLYYSLIPQVIFWVLLMIVLALAFVWNSLLVLPPSKSRLHGRRAIRGSVESLAGWVHKSQTGHYAKWQLANRLGGIARQLGEKSDEPVSTSSEDRSVMEYLDAGLNHSFVDFPAPANRFRRPEPTPLSLDPTIVVDYLEHIMEMSFGRHS